MVDSTGQSASAAGQVVGSRPPGSTWPSSTWASAAPNSCPPNQPSSTAGTSSRQGSSTGAPEFTTTTVRGLAATTARTRASWAPGNASERRSKPSLSIRSVVPTTTTATSAAAASSAACASPACSPSRGASAISSTATISFTGAGVCRSSSGTCCPAVSSTSTQVWVGLMNASKSWTDASSGCASTTAPATESSNCPAPA